MLTKSLMACAALLMLGASASAAPIYTYVGSWYVDDGPHWAAQDNGGNFTTPVLSGIEAAALIFGGTPSQYVVSTVSDQVADINFSAWMDGWADNFTYGLSGTPAPQALHIDIDNDGLYATPFATGAAYSAYVSDHGLHLQNFAFRVSNVGDPTPEPATFALLAIGAGGVAVSRFRRRKTAA